MRISHRLAVNLMILLAVFALTCPFAASALEVYKWTGDDGVVHYSESRPRTEPDDRASLETFHIANDRGAGDAEASRYRSMLNVAERLEQSRLARERARAHEFRDAPQGQPPAVTPPDADDNVNSRVIYPYASGYYRPHYPHYPQLYRPQSYYDRSTWPLNRGTVVPDVRQRADSYHPAARARAEGGEAIRTR